MFYNYLPSQGYIYGYVDAWIQFKTKTFLRIFFLQTNFQIKYAHHKSSDVNRVHNQSRENKSLFFQANYFCFCQFVAYCNAYFQMLYTLGFWLLLTIGPIETRYTPMLYLEVSMQLAIDKRAWSEDLPLTIPV